MDRIELLQGTLDMPILRTLRWGAQHGHGIGVAIRASSEDALRVEHGSLYPALHRLRKQGLVEAEWKLTENSAPGYYRLTALDSDIAGRMPVGCPTIGGTLPYAFADILLKSLVTAANHGPIKGRRSLVGV